MADLNPERIKLAQQLHRELASENRLQAGQARAFVRGLQVSWDVPSIQWTDEESIAQLIDARRLLHVAGMFEEIRGLDSAESQDCYRRAADILEWLTRAGDSLGHIVPIELFAAAAFQLGGLPAMANGLLSQLREVDPGTNLYASFLRADFDGVLKEALSFWESHPELTERESSTTLLVDGGQDGIEWFFTVELVRCISLIAASLRTGEDGRLESGLKKLRALDRMATRSFSDDIALLVMLVRAVADRYVVSSIYKPIKHLTTINSQQQTRLNRFARDQYSRGRGILWTSQILGINRLLDSSSFALCTPTGSGKTLVANFALIKELLLPAKRGLAPLALYLVPSRALASEVETKLTSELGHDLIITGLYGGTDWGITDYWLNAEQPTVLIATVEKADALMRYIGPLLIRRLRLLIVDEAHQVVPGDIHQAIDDFAQHKSRSLKLEAFVSKLLVRAPSIARIALTAVAGGASAPVAKWIEGRADAAPIGTKYRSTRQLIGSLEATPEKSGMISLRLMNGSPLKVRARGDEVYIPLSFPAMPKLPAEMRNSIACYNEVNVLWTALHLTDGDRRVLISIAQQPELTMGRFKKALALTAWKDVGRFAPPEEPLSRSLFNQARATAVDYCGPDSYEVALLDKGIASSHGQMPHRLRRLMTELIDKRICPITIATATLSEGVNLPFDLIFVTSLKRRTFDPKAGLSGLQKTTPISTSEFRNLAGRAGRPGAARDMEGMTLIALPMAPSTTADQTREIQFRQIASLHSDYNNLVAELEEEEQLGSEVESPLSLLIHFIQRQVESLYKLNGDEFLNWLEKITPTQINSNAGTASAEDTAILADNLDELDGIILGLLEEVAADKGDHLTDAETEELLTKLWQRSFSNVAAVQEKILEKAIVRRGCALNESIYTDSAERRRLYQYGFSPHVGRRFEKIQPNLLLVLEKAGDYGSASAEERFDFFEQLGALVANDRGFGFRGRDTVTERALLDNWSDTLKWWMGIQGVVGPSPADLRAWQRFVSDNFEFRLGVVLGAVVAQAWSAGADDPLAVPSLDKWRETTGLPWLGFWARELLRWGTLDPFVAFAMAQGIAGTRNEAISLKREFVVWMQDLEEVDSDDWIDPQRFLKWMRGREKSATDRSAVPMSIKAKLSGANGTLVKYNVLPVQRSRTVHWIDPAGFELAASDTSVQLSKAAHRNDYVLSHGKDGWIVERRFRPN